MNKKQQTDDDDNAADDASMRPEDLHPQSGAFNRLRKKTWRRKTSAYLGSEGSDEVHIY